MRFLILKINPTSLILIGLTCFVLPGLSQYITTTEPKHPIDKETTQTQQEPTATSAPSPTSPTSGTTEDIFYQQPKHSVTCITPDIQYGSCMPLAECSSLSNHLLLNPKNDTFIRYLRASNKVCDNLYAVVCCPDRIQNSKRQLAIFPKNSDGIPKKLPTMADGCGYVKHRLKHYEFSSMSEVGDWPWVALLGYDDGSTSGPSFKCGGTLITSRHVLTAAHCIRPDLTFVRLGEYDLSNDTETKHIDMPVVKVLKHPLYSKADSHNNIALLYFEKNVEFSERITPICVPLDEETRLKDFTHYHPLIAGWGKTMEDWKSVDVLEEITALIYENKACKDLYKKNGKYVSEEQFDDAVYCAADSKAYTRVSCHGDLGGPLMFPVAYEGATRYTLIGIVSYGFGCNNPEIPGLFTRVTKFIEWIENGVADTS